MATSTTTAENALMIAVGKLHPEYTIGIHHQPDTVYPYLCVTDGGYEVNTQIRLAKHHWDLQVIERLVSKAIKIIETKGEATTPRT